MTGGRQHSHTHLCVVVLTFLVPSPALLNVRLCDSQPLFAITDSWLVGMAKFLLAFPNFGRQSIWISSLSISQKKVREFYAHSTGCFCPRHHGPGKSSHRWTRILTSSCPCRQKTAVPSAIHTLAKTKCRLEELPGQECHFSLPGLLLLHRHFSALVSMSRNRRDHGCRHHSQVHLRFLHELLGV